jgi:hypothetical protein
VTRFEQWYVKPPCEKQQTSNIEIKYTLQDYQIIDLNHYKKDCSDYH